MFDKFFKKLKGKQAKISNILKYGTYVLGGLLIFPMLINFVVYMLSTHSLGRYQEWSADYIMHRDKNILKSLLCGCINFFKEGHTYELSHPGLQFFLKIFFPHPSTTSRIASWQKRLKALTND